MATDSPLTAGRHYYPAATIGYRDAVLPAHFGDVAAEYDAARTHAAVFDRNDRAVIEIRGGDRKSWLHNLVTNAVKTLDENQGVYAFATDVKARVLFEADILALTDVLWLVTDRLAVPVALAHLDHYLITEDVRLRDGRDEYAVLGCAGPQAEHYARRLGVAHFRALPALASVEIDDNGARLLRHDFCGPPGFELIVPREQAAGWWDQLVDGGARPAGFRALDALRIEAGIPWPGREIDGKVIPPETGQIERGISYHKGCYLGQEIIERMRAYGSLAKRLVRVKLPPGPELALPADLLKDGNKAGRITSLVPHPTEPYRIGLGYLKTAVSDATGLTVGEPAVRAEIGFKS